jgi:hypothetical protein
MNQQPKLTEEADTDALNIFGILRPDAVNGNNKSFVFVQRIWPALEFSDFSILKETKVTIDVYQVDSSWLSVDFPLLPPETGFNDTLFRPGGTFDPQPGQRFRITCSHSGLDTACGELIFPREPVIVIGSVQQNSGTVQFALQADSLIEMYEIYLEIAGQSFFVGREIADDNSDTEIDLELGYDLTGARLMIYGYENRLATYVGNSNISLNFNKYREEFSTLESGYGVFGALNFTELILE